MINVGAAQVESLYLRRTPSLTNLSIYFFNVRSCIFGTGDALKCFDFEPGSNSNSTGFVRKSPNVPSNKGSNSLSKFNISFGYSELRWQQLVDIILFKSARSYVASSILVTLLVASLTTFDSILLSNNAFNSF